MAGVETDQSLQDQEVIQHLMSGKVYAENLNAKLLAGSRAEGLAMLDCMGHGVRDIDEMLLCGGTFGINTTRKTDGEYVVCEDGAASSSYLPLQLLMDTLKTKPAYCRVKVEGDEDQLDRALLRNRTDKTLHNVIIQGEESRWLSSTAVMAFLQGPKPRGPKKVKGPAEQKYDELVEIVPGLVCSGPLPVICDFMERQQQNKKWPRKETLSDIEKLHGVLVCIGHKASRTPELEYRYSFSAHELLLAKDMPKWVRQGYVTFKYTVKTGIELLREAEETSNDQQTSQGRSLISTYHCKTALLWQLDDSKSWQSEESFGLFRLLVKRLHGYIHDQFLPHYFMPECNLLECVSDSEIEYARTCLESILQNPLQNIFNSIDLTDGFDQLFGGRESCDECLTALVTLESAAGTTAYKAAKANVRTNLQRLDSHRQKSFPTRVSLRNLFDKST